MTERSDLMTQKICFDCFHKLFPDKPVRKVTLGRQCVVCKARTDRTEQMVPVEAEDIPLVKQIASLVGRAPAAAPALPTLLAYLGQLVSQMVGHPLGSVCPPEESADAGAVAAARFDRPSGLPPEPFDELLPGNIGRTAADVSGHPNQLDSAQFRRGWRLPGRAAGQHVVVDDLRPGGWRFGAIAPRVYRQARTATSLPRLAPLVVPGLQGGPRPTSVLLRPAWA